VRRADFSLAEEAGPLLSSGQLKGKVDVFSLFLGMRVSVFFLSVKGRVRVLSGKVTRSHFLLLGPCRAEVWPSFSVHTAAGFFFGAVRPGRFFFPSGTLLLFPTHQGTVLLAVFPFFFTSRLELLFFR